MYGEFLRDESLSEDEKKEFFEVVMCSLNRLSFLVESMIKMSRLECGVITLKYNLSNLNDTILMSINQVQKKVKEKNINIMLEEVAKVTYENACKIFDITFLGASLRKTSLK